MSGLDYVILKLEGDFPGEVLFTPDSGTSRFGMGGRGTRGLGPDDLLGGALESEERPVARIDDMSIETATLNEHEVVEAKRNPKNLVAPKMPIVLVEPVATRDESPQVGQSTGNGEAEVSWGVRRIGADTSSLTGKEVKVALLDSGIDPSHPAFEGLIDERNRKNFTASDDDDRHGHGTHCAGTIFGRDIDGMRIGIARGVTEVLIGKVLDDKGQGTTDAVLEGLKWVHSNGANVVSMSLGFDFPKMQDRLMASRPPRLATSLALKAYRENLRAFETLIAFLLQETQDRPGMVLVAASGNESDRDKDPDYVIDVSMPAAASRDLISVGATRAVGESLGIASFSNINPTVCAPGVGIVSAALGGGLKPLSGTSMACPHVAGVAALHWERLTATGNASGNSVRGSLIGTARTDCFTTDVMPSDRGNGHVVAPQT